jgi:cyclic beta-1,2-glucan synthetase
MGTGDWNDGMNRIGELGRGESVWLAWFLHATLQAFEPLSRRTGDVERPDRWLAHASNLRTAIEASGWDGQWYRRAFFDDGTPVGSSVDSECRIDSIAQSWAVLSGAGMPERAQQAMHAVMEQLVIPESGLALLFSPPFDHGAVDPGYVKGYPPGVRENGGQYTHAAAWSVIALATLGDGDGAASLLGMINPINRTSTRANLQRYKVEPYVTAADVYSVAPHVGRGGWTWYTGSSGWMYRAGLEAILGFRRQGGFLNMAPCIPRTWPRFEISYRYGTTRYEILVENPNRVCRGVSHAEFDGVALSPGEARIGLIDDGGVHHLRITLG